MVPGAFGPGGGDLTDGKGKKVLVIDADQEFSDQLKEALEGAGYVVDQAYTSKQGLNKLEFFQPDLIILEVLLEENDSGFLLAKEIRKHPIFGKVPIFMLTAVAEKTGGKFSLEEDGYWMKVDDFADKPLPTEEILARVEKLLEKRGGE